MLTREDGTLIDVPGLGKEAVLAYCDLVVNSVLYRFGLKQVYQVDKEVIPSWMESIADVLKANFYENSVGNYSQFSTADIEEEEGEEESDEEVDF